MKYSVLFVFLACCVPLMRAQSDYVPGGGGVSAGGSVYVTFGQAACVYGTDANFYNGQGVQQPYCTPRFDTIIGEVCQSNPFSIADFLLTADSTATMGLHYFSRHYLTAEGCDSTLTLALTVHAASSETVTATACDRYEWHDRVFLSDTLFDYHTANIHGCDSTATLRLTLRHSSRSEVSEQGAYQYSWHDRTYTESGDYTDTMRSANAEGCDSIVSLRLSLLTDAAVPTIYCFSRRLIMVDHYPWGEDSTTARCCHLPLPTCCSTMPLAAIATCRGATMWRCLPTTHATTGCGATRYVSQSTRLPQRQCCRSIPIPQHQAPR